MDTDVSKKRCSFCGEVGREETKLAGGLGAWICGPCVEYRHEVNTSAEKFLAAKEPPWTRMSNTEIVAVIPQIAQTAIQVEDFLVEWVGLARERGVSWAEIGKSLGVSRQSSWQRFAHRIDQGAPDIPQARSGA